MERLFGTDGIRGVAGSFPLDEGTLYACGRSLARHLARQTGRSPRIVTGRDTRESGRWIEGFMTKGLRDQGAEVCSAGIITTPGIAYLAREQPFDAGVVISASHNPMPDNGIKIFSTKGRKLESELERAIEEDLHNSPQPLTCSRPGWIDYEDTLIRSYMRYLTREVGRDLDLSGVSLAVDCAHGAASEIAPEVFASLGAEVHLMGASPNGQNINQRCGCLHIQELSQWIIDQPVELGIAFDGDADRVLFVSPTGHVFDGDHILFVAANHLKSSGRLNHNLVVATVMSNLGLERGLEERGITLHRTQVGDRYVLEKLLELDGSLGGEQSGHIIFPSISEAGDGIITALITLRIIRQARSPLEQLCEGFRHYPQELLSVQVARKPPLASIPAVARQVRAVERELAGRGRLLLRYSGTENKARVMIEADDQALVTRLAHQLARTIEETLG